MSSEMKNRLVKSYYAGLTGLMLFEIMNVYFIMPMPGSQEIQSLNLAYFLYSYRWIFRIIFILPACAGLYNAFSGKKLFLPILFLLAAGLITWVFNFRMSADSMFRQPITLVFKNRKENTVNENSLAICISFNGQSKAYPIRFIQYHHQVRDAVGGRPVMVTYCNVCRTGRVYLPVVNGKDERFRLVGMDHFNAMFEDKSTRSWWRQSTGEAVAGKLKGQMLPEAESMQMTLKNLFDLDSNALVMQPDGAFVESYDSLGKFETGRSKSKLTRTDTISWKSKSWVVGVSNGKDSKAYDWNQLKKESVINDKLGELPVVVLISADRQNFGVFRRPSESTIFSLRNDTLFGNSEFYDLNGNCLSRPGLKLERIRSYQEFWHSWKYFHPDSQQYN